MTTLYYRDPNAGDRKAPTTPPPGDPAYAGPPQSKPEPPPAPPAVTGPTTDVLRDIKDAGTLCAHCSRRKDEHHLVNYADGPRVGEASLVCPTSVFQDRWLTPRATAAAARAEDSR